MHEPSIEERLHRYARLTGTPPPPEELEAFLQTLDTPTRARLAHNLLNAGIIDGWEALAFAAFGQVVSVYDDTFDRIATCN